MPCSKFVIGLLFIYQTLPHLNLINPQPPATQRINAIKDISVLCIMLIMPFENFHAVVIKTTFAIFTPFWIIKLSVHPKFVISLVKFFVISTMPTKVYSKCLYSPFNKLHHNFKFCVIN
jgi:hypothetical protein